MTESEQAAREVLATVMWCLDTHGIDVLGILAEYDHNPRVLNALGLWDWLQLDEQKH